MTDEPILPDPSLGNGKKLDAGTGGEPTVRVHLFGSLPFDEALQLQRRIVYEASGERRALIQVLLCEHPWTLTVGRSGSRGDIQLSGLELERLQLQTKWVSRGGGVVLHGPGQLAAYVVAPLEQLGWDVGQYARRLQAAASGTLDALRVPYHAHPQSWNLWGRSGLLFALGLAIRGGVAYQGLFLNVNPAMTHYSFVHTAAATASRLEPRPAWWKSTMGSLLAERRSAAKMPLVRSILADQLARALGSERYHLFTGHPWLKATHSRGSGTRERNARAS